MRRLNLCLAALIALSSLIGCQKRGEPELSLTQEQWRRARTNILPELPVDHIETPLAVQVGDILELRGVTGLNRQIQSGNTLKITTYWEVLEETNADVSFNYRLVQDELVDEFEHRILDGQLPARMWEKGTILRDEVSLLVQPMFHGATQVHVDVLSNGTPLKLRSEDREPASTLGNFITIWNPPRISARYTNEPIIIDGIAAEHAWKSAAQTEPWRDPRDGSESEAQKTTAQLLWSDEGLYLFIKAYDEHIWGTLLGRDQHLWEEEVIEVFLDPLRDNKKYVEIQVSPLNTVFDAIFETAGDRNLDKAKAHNLSGLRTAVFMRGSLNDPSDRDSHWAVEMFIPFADLPGMEFDAKGRPGTLGLNLYRYDRPDENTVHTTAWSPVGPGTFHRPERFGAIHWADAPSAPSEGASADENGAP